MIHKILENSTFSEKLIGWYLQNKRNLPWRSTKEPYLIWVSEIILQQTRVLQGTPYFYQITSELPDIYAMANAPEEQILRLWQGLGYYSRARNMHKCAKVIATDYNGQFPPSYQELIKLPGIGPYTAAAIASFAFNENVAVVDGNVLRAICRIFGLDDDISEKATQGKVSQIAETLLPKGNSYVFNQAIMEFGAVHCTPKKPLCHICPFDTFCAAKEKGLQNVLPVKLKKIKKRDRYFNYLVLRKGDEIGMQKRANNDIWKNLYEFKLIETDKYMSFEELLGHDFFQEIKDWVVHTKEGNIKPVKHVLSHQNIYATFNQVTISMETPENYLQNIGIQTYTLDQVEQLPKPILVDNYLQQKLI